jgi:hypothetical protein
MGRHVKNGVEGWAETMDDGSERGPAQYSTYFIGTIARRDNKKGERAMGVLATVLSVHQIIRWNFHSVTGGVSNFGWL